MAWDDHLLQAQRAAAAHAGTHARLLAGPGTGKTLILTRRICFLEFLTKLFEVVPTDEYTSDVEEGLMDFGSPLPAHS